MSWTNLLAAAARVRSSAVTADPALAELPLAGIGWATVEYERAQRELEGALWEQGSGGVPAWESIGRDPALGAGMWRYATPDPASGLQLAILEPDTEGRLAASLARFGEGVAVVYLGEGRVRPGRVVRGGPAWGPHVVLL